MSLKEIKKILINHKDDLSKRGVKTLSIFGSIAKNKGTAKSDIDILIDFDSKKGFFVFVDLKMYLENILNREVDLVTKNALHPFLRKQILLEAKDVF